MPLLKCKNCGHELWQVSKNEYEHYARDYEHPTRDYIPAGYPYSTVRCYAPGCHCVDPVMPHSIFQLVKLGGGGRLWVIKKGHLTLSVCDENDLKSLAEQLKEFGF